LIKFMQFSVVSRVLAITTYNFCNGAILAQILFMAIMAVWAMPSQEQSDG
jgi:hypothetical protein